MPVQCSAAIAADMAGPAAIIEPTFGAGGVLLLGRAGEQPRGYYGRGLPRRAADSRSNQPEPDRVAWEIVGGDGAEHGEHRRVVFNNSSRSNTLSVSSIIAGVGVGLGVAGSGGLARSSTTPSM